MKRQNIQTGFLKVATLAAAALAVIAPASANLVPNGTFSGTPVGPGYQTFTSGGTFAGGDWTVSSGSVDWVSSYWTGPGTPPQNSVDLDGNAPGGILSKGFATVIGSTYSVSFDLSGNPDGGNAKKTLDVTPISGTDLFTNSYSFNTATFGNTHSDMDWQPTSFTFVANSTTSQLLFFSGDAAPSPYGPVIADIDVELSSTPEPALYGALAVGFSGVLYALRRRKQA